MAESTEPGLLIGTHGTARLIPRDTFRASHPAGLDSWILTGPRWHPVWYQYNLGLVTLADTPGLPPANRRNSHVTHELTVVALDPDHGPYDARHLPDGRLRFLTPVNIAEQFVSTDKSAREIAFLCARAVVDGHLWPETGDAPDRVRAHWRTTVRQTLDHDRTHGQEGH